MIPPETIIETEAGPRTIIALYRMPEKPKVLTRNQESGKLEFKPILACVASDIAGFIDVLTRDGRHIRLTRDHWIASTKHWVFAKWLCMADELFSLHAASMNESYYVDPVIAVSDVMRALEAGYDIEVANNRNYFANGVLVGGIDFREPV